jgi:hypothetical protein
MSTCPGCGGVVGRDCFNPQECMWITQQQANQAEYYYQREHEAQNSLQQAKGKIMWILRQWWVSYFAFFVGILIAWMFR